MLYERMSTHNHGNEVSGENGSSIRAVIDRDKLATALAAVTAAQADGDVGWVQFQFTGPVLAFKFFVLAHIRCNHFFDLPRIQ